MGDHAILSASSSSRWIHCPPSVRLSQKYEDEVSPYALEGNENVARYVEQVFV